MHDNFCERPMSLGSWKSQEPRCSTNELPGSWGAPSPPLLPPELARLYWASYADPSQYIANFRLMGVSMCIPPHLVYYFKLCSLKFLKIICLQLSRCHVLYISSAAPPIETMGYLPGKMLSGHYRTKSLTKYSNPAHSDGLCSLLKFYLLPFLILEPFRNV